jgi:hypothetical protein
MLLAAISPAAWYNIGLVVVLIAVVVAAVLAYRVWSEVNEDIAPASTDELLQSFEEARAAGELDDEEYARVRQRLEQGPPPAAGPEEPSARQPFEPGARPPSG